MKRVEITGKSGVKRKVRPEEKAILQKKGLVKEEKKASKTKDEKQTPKTK